jgi:hypothetical protein
VQDLALNRGDDQVTGDFIGHLKTFSVNGPSIDPVIDKCASIAKSNFDVAIKVSGDISQRSRLI